MNELQLRDRALEIARTTPGDLLANAERIYQWLVQTSAVKQGEVTFLPPQEPTLVSEQQATVDVQGEAVISSVVSNLVGGTTLVRR